MATQFPLHDDEARFMRDLRRLDQEERQMLFRLAARWVRENNKTDDPLPSGVIALHPTAQ